MRPMDTAAAIARVRADEAALPEQQRLFADPYAELFASDGDAEAVSLLFESLPFFREHVRLRTRFIDDFVRMALADGIQQVVLLGAGFDCRALRLPELGRASVFEVDLEEQHQKKARILAAAGLALPAHVRAVSADLAEDDLQSLLERHGYQTDVAAAFVAEGIAGYLDRAALRQLTADALRAGADRLVVNYSSAAWLPEQVGTLLLEAGWPSTRHESYETLHRSLLGSAPGPGHERYHISVAQRP